MLQFQFSPPTWHGRTMLGKERASPPLSVKCKVLKTLRSWNGHSCPQEDTRFKQRPLLTSKLHDLASWTGGSHVDRRKGKKISEGPCRPRSAHSTDGSEDFLDHDAILFPHLAPSRDFNYIFYLIFTTTTCKIFS